jgi:ABC-type transport system substrate-binding protein
MTMTLKTLFSISFTAMFLTGCTSMNLFKDSPEPQPPVADLEPEEPKTLGPSASPSAKGLSAGQINRALSGKSWKWKGPNNAGVTLFANDGSSLVEVTGKGTTTGKWMAKDGQLCEKFEPAPFLPKGVPMTCQPITGSGNTYRVGQATFTLAL